MRALVDAEAEDARRVGLGAPGYNELRVCEQKEVRKGGAEVGAVKVGVLGGPRVVRLVALRAEDLHGELPCDVRQPHRQHGLPMTEGSGTPAEVHVLELLVHLVHAGHREHVPRMDQPVQHLSRRLNDFMLVLREVVWRVSGSVRCGEAGVAVGVLYQGGCPRPESCPAHSHSTGPVTISQ